MTSISSLLNPSDDGLASMDSPAPARMRQRPDFMNDGLPMSTGSSALSSESSSRESLQTENSTPLTSVSDVSLPSGNIGKSMINKCKVDKRFLGDKKLVKLAIRRKSMAKKSQALENHQNSKLHVKALEAGLKVKLTRAPSIASLYNSLVPHTSKRKITTVSEPSTVSYAKNLLSSAESNEKLVPKSVHLIDNNLVNMSGFSNKILQTFSLEANADKCASPEGKNGKQAPTFNKLTTAVHTLFGTDQYSLVRVTRSSVDDSERSILLKLETAAPGDLSLIDDHEFFDEMYYSIGKQNESPTNLFVKKVVARPRYKSDMKIYFVPADVSCSLYTDPRMFERDLINGIIDLDTPQRKAIYATFPFTDIVADFRRLVKLSENYRDKVMNQSGLIDVVPGSPNAMRYDNEVSHKSRLYNDSHDSKESEVKLQQGDFSDETSPRMHENIPVAGVVMPASMSPQSNSEQISPIKDPLGLNIQGSSNSNRIPTILPDPLSSYYRRNSSTVPITSPVSSLPSSMNEKRENGVHQ